MKPIGFRRIGTWKMLALPSRSASSSFLESDLLSKRAFAAAEDMCATVADARNAVLSDSGKERFHRDARECAGGAGKPGPTPQLHRKRLTGLL